MTCKIWLDKEEAIVINFGGVARNVHWDVELIRIQEVENGVNVLRNGKTARIDVIQEK